MSENLPGSPPSYEESQSNPGPDPAAVQAAQQRLIEQSSQPQLDEQGRAVVNRDALLQQQRERMYTIFTTGTTDEIQTEIQAIDVRNRGNWTLLQQMVNTLMENFDPANRERLEAIATALANLQYGNETAELDLIQSIQEFLERAGIRINGPVASRVLPLHIV